MLSAEQNDSQSKETNVINEFREKNRPVPMQEAEIRWKRAYLVETFCLLCLVAVQKIAHAAHSLSRLGELHM